MEISKSAQYKYQQGKYAYPEGWREKMKERNDIVLLWIIVSVYQQSKHQRTL